MKNYFIISSIIGISLLAVAPRSSRAYYAPYPAMNNTYNYYDNNLNYSYGYDNRYADQNMQYGRNSFSGYQYNSGANFYDYNYGTNMTFSTYTPPRRARYSNNYYTNYGRQSSRMYPNSPDFGYRGYRPY